MSSSHITRRKFLKTLAALAGGAVLAPFGRALPTLASARLEPYAPATLGYTPTARDFVTVRGDQFYLSGTRLPIRGFNYYPRTHPWKIFHLGEWEPGAIDYELGLGASLGANVVRTFIDFNASLDNTRAQQPIENYYAATSQYVEHIRQFIEIAGRWDLLVIATLLDGMGRSFYQPQNAWMVEEYLRALVPIFAKEPRILCWDLQNEPDRAIREVGADVVIPFFKRISTLVRTLAPNHLQTIGWTDRARAQYFPDLDESLDFWCFHFYDRAANLPPLVRFYKTRTNKPVLLEEFGLATGGPGAAGANTEAEQAAHYTQVLTTIDDAQMCGSVFWCLTNFPQGLAGNPPIPDDHPENHFGVFRLDYTPKPVVQVLKSLWGNAPRPKPQ